MGVGRQMKDGRRELRLRQMLVLGRWVDAGQMLVGCRSCCAAQVALRGARRRLRSEV